MKALSVGLALLAVPLSAATPPEISFEPEAVVVHGITSRGQTVWFSVAREISRRSTNIVPRHAIVTDEDGDGSVRLELGQEVPLRSIWFAVDFATGETAVAVPEGFPLLEMDLPGQAIPAALNRLDLERRFAYLLLVRPGVGAWHLRVGNPERLPISSQPGAGWLQVRLKRPGCGQARPASRKESAPACRQAAQRLPA